MKKGLLLLSLILFSLQASHAQTLTKKEFAEKNIRFYKNVKQTGIFIGVAGVASTLTGLFILSNVPKNSSNNKYLPGEILMSAGVGMLVTGIIMDLDANAKLKRYQPILSGLTLSPLISTTANGFCLQYKF